MEEGGLPLCPLYIKAGNGIGHVIPQKINGMQDLNLSLRVKYPMEECHIVVCQGEQQVAVKKMKRAIPAEMIHIPVKAQNLRMKENLEVRVDW